MGTTDEVSSAVPAPALSKALAELESSMRSVDDRVLAGWIVNRIAWMLARVIGLPLRAVRGVKRRSADLSPSVLLKLFGE